MPLAHSQGSTLAHLARSLPVRPFTFDHGQLSRNRTVGQRLGKGETLKEILATSKEVAEGVATTPAASELAAKLGVRTPIIHAMAALIKGELTARETLLELMNEPVYDEEA